jgi:hypothetical protein
LQDSLEVTRAYHLHTECLPTIYYRPYRLSEDQKATIERQRADAQAKFEASVQVEPLKRRDSTLAEPISDADVTRTEAEVHAPPSPTTTAKNGANLDD